MADTKSVVALTFALAALGNGSGGGSGGTVSVTVDSTITGAPGTQANVVNLGNDQEVALQFTIPQGLQGESGSKWFTSTAADGTLVSGMNNGDYVLYISGKVYVQENGVLSYTGIDLVPTIQGVTPYEYAVQNGYTGTEDEFKISYINLLDGKIENGNNYIQVDENGVTIKGLTTDENEGTSPVTVDYLNNILNNMILNGGSASS